jgi:hypothetical protein
VTDENANVAEEKTGKDEGRYARDQMKNIRTQANTQPIGYDMQQSFNNLGINKAQTEYNKEEKANVEADGSEAKEIDEEKAPMADYSAHQNQWNSAANGNFRGSSYGRGGATTPSVEPSHRSEAAKGGFTKNEALPQSNVYADDWGEDEENADWGASEKCWPTEPVSGTATRGGFGARGGRGAFAPSQGAGGGTGPSQRGFSSFRGGHQGGRPNDFNQSEKNFGGSEEKPYNNFSNDNRRGGFSSATGGGGNGPAQRGSFRGGSSPFRGAGGRGVGGSPFYRS